ncbi:MAG: L,D-transpeptidase family protein [Ginsengibacter sp.]
MKKLFIFLILAVTAVSAFPQNSFVEIKKASLKSPDIFISAEDTVRKQFEAKGLQWPAKFVYIRSFKYDANLEIWVKNAAKDQYKLFKTYKVCMQSGTMGPKRLQGDYQVPEGCYYINEFNPNSNYHLALGLNYPNASDKILSDSLRPGGDIYIHGSCVSVGCIPVTDKQIEEIYVITSYAKNNGEEFIPVHVFPIKYDQKKSLEYLQASAKNNPALEKFALKLKPLFDRFQETKQLPIVMIDKKGEYIVN